MQNLNTTKISQTQYSFFLFLFISLTLSLPVHATWKKEVVSSINLNLTTLNNWAEGGEGALTWNLKASGKFELDTTKYNWTNQGKIGYGQTKLGDDDFRKSLDEIFFETLYRYKLTSLLNPYGSATLQSQWTKGYKYTDTSKTPQSSFWDPGYLTQSVGMGLNPVENLILRLGFSLKQTFSEKYGFADKAETKKVESLLIEPGLESISTYSLKFKTILKYDTKFGVFVNFKGIEEIDAKWENLFTAQLAKFLQFQFGLTMLYDVNQDKETQIKQDMSLALSYSFF